MKIDWTKWMQASGWSTSLLQLSLPLAIYQGWGAEWYWWATAMFFYIVVYSLIGNNIALHRYFTHGHFEVSKPVEYFFLWCGSMSGLGNPISYAMTHLVHHKYPDTDKDPHGPVRGLKSIFPIWHGGINIKETPINARGIVALSRKYGWLHKYYIPFVAVNAYIMYLISPTLFLFAWWIPASISCIGVAGAVITQHWSFKPNNGCKYNKYLLWYEAHHKNHHDFPSAPDTSLDSEERDYTFEFAKLFKPRFNWQGQPNRDA